MSDPGSISVRSVSKKYRLFSSPTQRLHEALHPFRRKLHREFWALHDLTFDIEAGKTVGVLGMNGSGKSTLLQIIAGVLEPTGGEVEVSGRVAALLELGAGFNPELSGRENVITNQLMLGLTRREVNARLGEVEAFADIGMHFDQPVKTYSSGMFMRVAFASAICVDPDILIIDEALAVGDSKFQEKCFRRLREFQDRRRTVLFVTHDRASVVQFCDDAFLLHHGALVARGKPKTVVDFYTELLTTGRLPSGSPVSTPLPAPAAQAADAGTSPLECFLAERSNADRLAANPLYNLAEQRWGNGGARVIDALVVADAGVNPGSLLAGSQVDVHVKVVFDSDMEAPLVGMTLTNTQGTVIYGTHSGWLRVPIAAATAGEVRGFRFRLRLPLSVGAYFLELAVARDQDHVTDVRSRALHIEILRDRMLMGLVDLDADFAAT